MTDVTPDVPGGTPLADIPAPAVGTAITASGLVAAFTTGYLLANPSLGPAWVVTAAAGVVLVLAVVIAIVKGVSNGDDN